MVRENNFLLGHGERLTKEIKLQPGGDLKSPPYDFVESKERVGKMLSGTVQAFNNLPQEACPNNQVVAKLTLHPRYISKSDFPNQLLKSVHLTTVGSRPQMVRPEKWGIKKHGDEALSEELFVIGSRDAFQSWGSSVSSWEENYEGAKQLLQVEKIEAFRAIDKLRSLPDVSGEAMFEVVLHNAGAAEWVLEEFETYARYIGTEPIMARKRNVRGLSFVPVKADPKDADKLAQFSFVRVARGMPEIRPIPSIIRSTSSFTIQLPKGNATAPDDVRVAIFDGGLPDNSNVSQWVSYHQPMGIGPPNGQSCDHGLAVTGTVLFGPINNSGHVQQAMCNVDHFRVLDENTGTDLEYLDVLDNILSALDNGYEFVNLSIGPDMAIDDDDVTLWTASLDQRFAGGKVIATVAVGNDGTLDSASGLDRIQPPSDGVNMLSVGSCDCTVKSWDRAEYSCVGPGRCPGLIKPDGVAFGGSIKEPFKVLGQNGNVYDAMGTSFAAPLALRSAVSVKAQLGNRLSQLAIRALMIHRADSANNARIEVGWGRFETDPNLLITCDDTEALVIYEEELPIDQELRVPVPMVENMTGMVTLTATLLIAPEVDPEYPGAYTRSGLDVIFRPHSERYNVDENGKASKHPTSQPFFSDSRMFGSSELVLRQKACKWEPCRKHSQRFYSESLFEPCFDIKYHQRQGGRATNDVRPIKYAFVVSIKAPKIPNLYDRIVRNYANVLIPLQPRLRVPIRV